jgi:YVTN family beta-propeller protein
MAWMGIGRLRAPPAVALLIAGGLVGCLGDGGHPARDGVPHDRPPGVRAPVKVAGVELYPVPDAVVEACRATQERADTTVLCPSRLPRPVRDLAGSTALPPPVLTAFCWGGTGIDISYSAESGRPRLDAPDRFLHLQVMRQDAPLPPGTRPDGLGGRPGLLAPATGGGYASETYFGNHWRFFWSEQDADYAATLHDFGPRTKPLLDWLVGDLRPARSLAARRDVGDPPGVRTIDVRVPGPVSLALHDGQVWVAGQGNRSVSASWLARLDASTGRPAGERLRITRADGMPALLAGDGGMWIGHRGIPGSAGLQLVAEASGEPMELHAVDPDVVALARAAGSLWVLDFGDWPAGRHRGSVLDPVEGRRVPVGHAPAAMASGGGHLWVTNNLDDTLTRIDPRTARVAGTIPVGDGPVGVAAGHGAVWVANTQAGTVTRIDPRKGWATATIAVGHGPRGMAAGEHGIWVTNSLDDSVSRIDPDTNRVVETIPVGAGPSAIAVRGGAVWVANNHDGTVSRISR